jgi:steroid 5-alpha reductase family enzyme
MTVTGLLLANLALLLLCALALWAYSLGRRDVTIIDSYWPLGIHLFRRWRHHGADRRYQALLDGARAKRGWSFAKASLLLVFLLQPPLQFIVCLPVQLGQLDPQPTAFGLVGWAGAVLALLGILFESVADWQLVRFRRRAAPDAVLDTGLWRYTRHPNYFGDACVWWGLYLIAAETSYGAWSLPGPLLLTWTLMRWSGVPMLERGLKARRPAYEDYVRRTSGFVPWPPLGEN